MKRQLKDLRVGQRFRLYDLKGKLIRKGPGSADVEIVRHTERHFRTRDGREVKIRTSRERTAWSLRTEVEVGS
jgi:hypothetical protein